MKYTYSSGQRPLDGYTIKRGVGKGGFGEVYFAISDGGKEVALKLLRSGQADIELRGIRQCLNLKHTNLVALFDVRTDAHGESWVIMEYIAGETLSAILNRHPRGLPQELIQQWFPSLCRCVNYLHDHGIVHRDLKPGNIFLEHGLLKVGDYGLSKSMSSSHRSAQTSSVGTVHYMAPEISSGRYDKSVDIYALGVILYEMLSGEPPFDGESAQEIMMKHLMSLPDLNKVPGPYKQVLAKALAKDPNHRHATAAELVKDVEAIFNNAPIVKVVESVPVVVDAPRPVTVPVATMATPRPRPVGRAVEVPIPRPPAPAEAPKPDPPTVVPFTLRDRVAELSGSLAMSAVMAVVCTTIITALFLHDDRVGIGSLLFLTVAVCWSILIPGQLWSSKPGNEWMRRLVLTFCGTLVGLLAFWLDGWTPGLSESPTAMMGIHSESSALGLSAGAGYLSYFGLSLGLIRWWRAVDRRRSVWFSFFPVLTAGVWALALLVVWPNVDRPYGAASLVLGSMIVQWVSPWQVPPVATPKRLKLRRA
jgi:hypothetical protein